MTDKFREAIRFDEEHLGIDLSPIDEEIFSNAFMDYKTFIRYCNRKYGTDRPPKDSGDYHKYVEIKRNLAKYFVHCKDENFKKVLLTQHPEFGDL